MTRDHGTCYLAENPAGCFLEVFRDWLLVPEVEVKTRRLAELALPATAGRLHVIASTTVQYYRGDPLDA